MAGSADPGEVARTQVTHLLLKGEPTSTVLPKMFRSHQESFRPCLHSLWVFLSWGLQKKRGPLFLSFCSRKNKGDMQV